MKWNSIAKKVEYDKSITLTKSYHNKIDDKFLPKDSDTLNDFNNLKNIFGRFIRIDNGLFLSEDRYNSNITKEEMASNAIEDHIFYAESSNINGYGRLVS